MARMVIVCAACSAQNFVSEERRIVREIPPRCWKCGEALPEADETGSGSAESKQGVRGAQPSGRIENA